MSTSKTGKHGHAKANFTAIDIFTGKKMEDIVPTSHSTSVPNVKRVEYTLLDISDDGFLSLLTGEFGGREWQSEFVLSDVFIPPDRCMS